jgi:hypothetical protein
MYGKFRFYTQAPVKRSASADFRSYLPMIRDAGISARCRGNVTSERNATVARARAELEQSQALGAIECARCVLLCTMPPYCATELQGDKCTDSWCQYRHDILRCELCGRSFPAPLLQQHENGKLHLSNVHLSGLLSDQRDTTSIDQWTSPPSSPFESASLSSEPQMTPPPSEGNTSITKTGAGVDPRVIVSGEGGVDFIVEGKGTAAYPKFLVAKRKITIEKTEVVSSLSVESLTLAYSLDECRWCESFSASVHELGFSLYSRSFSAYLIGATDVVKKRKPRTIVVSFEPPYAGTFNAMLKINFGDRTRPHTGGFTVTCGLRGHAGLPASSSVVPASGGDDVPSDTVFKDTPEDGLEDPGITVSPDLALDFSVESLDPNEPFPTQTKKFVITRSESSHILVSFTAARICSPEDSMIE